ncbi:hypothetical protein N7G274_008572 [Stereocaulon virgatum]|uniref:DUF7029 domain-containing protein n=1 Tax=Stereocaulon virgatum TaxID=373712 RepID=A0ABR4A000_9LECA
MYQHLFTLFSILASTSTIRAVENVTPSSSQSTGPTVLRPIHIANYDAALGLHPRAPEDFSHLNLQTQSQMIYGSPGNNGQLLLAQMTLYAPDGLLLIMMERFEGLTSSVDCKGDDGTISLTFNSENAFNHALQEWSYINQNDNGTFLLIANHDG